MKGGGEPRTVGSMNKRGREERVEEERIKVLSGSKCMARLSDSGSLQGKLMENY